MQLIGRVLILAVCVLSAYSFPNFNIDDEKSFIEGLKNKFEDMVHNHFGSSNQTDNNSTYPNNNNTNNNNTNNNNNNTNNNNNNTNNNNNNTVALNSCLLSFNLQEQAISNETAAKIELCYQPNNQSLVFLNQNQTSNNTSNNSSDVKEVNAVSRQLQQNLKQCTRKNCSNGVFKCNVNSFDRNLQDLAEITQKSQQGLVSPGGNQTLVAEQQSACVGGVLIDSKIKAIQNFNALSWCLGNIAGNGTSVNGTHHAY